MALKIDITDQKGVKTRYHRIKNISIEAGSVKLTVRGYVNQSTRDSEKQAAESNTLAQQYDQETDALRARLDELSAQITPDGKGDESVIAEIKDVSAQVNERAANTDRPQYQQIVDKFYDEVEIEVSTPEVITLDNLYAELTKTSRYSGAEEA